MEIRIKARELGARAGRGGAPHVDAPMQPSPGGQGLGYAGSATARSSLSPFVTIRNTSSANGRCSASASPVSAASHWSTSAAVVRMTGMALGWIGATIALASVVRKPNSSCTPSTGALLGPRVSGDSCFNLLLLFTERRISLASQLVAARIAAR